MWKALPLLAAGTAEPRAAGWREWASNDLGGAPTMRWQRHSPRQLPPAGAATAVQHSAAATTNTYFLEPCPTQQQLAAAAAGAAPRAAFRVRHGTQLQLGAVQQVWQRWFADFELLAGTA